MFDSEFLEKLVSNLLSISVIGGLAVWLIKSIITKFFENNSEKFKNQLQSELEIHKSKLQLDHHKNTKLHDEQCEFIKLLFQELCMLDTHLEKYIRLVESDREVNEEDRENIFNPIVFGIKKIDELYKTNRILINENISNKVKETIYLLYNGLAKTSIALIIKSKDIDLETRKGIAAMKFGEMTEKEQGDFDSIMTEIKQIKNVNLKESIEELEKHFRQLFGIK